MAVSDLACALAFAPDVKGLRQLNGLPAELSDVEVAEYAFQRRRALTGKDALPPALRQLAGFAYFGRRDGAFQLHSAAGACEAELLTAFCELAAGSGLSRWSEQEASLTSLSLRALQAGLSAGQGWAGLRACSTLASLLAEEVGEAPCLETVARLAGLPLPRGGDDEACWRAVQARDWAAIRVDAELRALASWLLGLRYRTLSAQLEQAQREAEEQDLRSWLLANPAAHLRAFATAWSG